MKGRGVVVKASPMKVTIKLPRGGYIDYLNTGGFEVGDEVRYYTDATGKHIQKLLPLEVARVKEMLGRNPTLQTAIREDSHVETSPNQGFDPEELVDSLGHDPGAETPGWYHFHHYAYPDDEVVRAHDRDDDREEGGETADLQVYFPYEP